LTKFINSAIDLT